MTTQVFVALFALGVLWVNTLLVAGSALQLARAIRARWMKMRPISDGKIGDGLIAGTIDQGEPLARRAIDQVGRQTVDRDGQPAIAFHDRDCHSEVLGGVLRVGSAKIAVAAPDAKTHVEVWVDDVALAAAARSEDAQFDAAYSQAGTARGYTRQVRAELRTGTRVWAFGAVNADTLTATAEGELLLSTLDPRKWCARQQLRLALFIAGVLAAAAVCTTLALWPPRFGSVSKLGAGLGLIYFLSVQPLGTLLRDQARLPSSALLRGHWRRSR